MRPEERFQVHVISETKPKQIKLCENCENKPATSRFRSIRVCFDCSEELHIAEKDFRGRVDD